MSLRKWQRSLSQRGEDKERVFLADTDLFFFYLRGGKFELQAEKVIQEASAGSLELRTSSEVYDDAISAIRANGSPLNVAHSFVSDMKSIPHSPLPMSAEVSEDALSMYIKHGGRRRLSYFDSFHVATAKRYVLTLLTSDRYIVDNAQAFGMKTKDLSDWK